MTNPQPCEKDGTCQYRPEMKFFIEEMMCVDDGVQERCRAYYQTTFLYTATQTKGDGYSIYGFDSYGKNENGESITEYHAVCRQEITAGQPDTYLAIPQCRLEKGSHVSIPLQIGQIGGACDQSSAFVAETLTHYDRYNRPDQNITHCVPIAKFLVGLDDDTFEQNRYGLSLRALEAEGDAILRGHAECRSVEIRPPALPVNECSFVYRK
jgi:hypothetical protein